MEEDYEDDAEWIEELLDNDELTDWEAGFMRGCAEAENEGFE